MLLIQQIKAGRALLDWSQADLGKHAGLSKTAITNIESGRFRPTVRTLDAIKVACEAAGLEFIEGGVRYNSPTVKIIKGPNFTSKMRDFKLATCVKKGIKELLYSGLNPTLMTPEEFQETERHMQRIRSHKIKTRMIVSDKRKPEELPGELGSYRCLPDKFLVDTSPFFIMGPYIGMMLYDVQEVLILLNENQANYQKRIFEFLWKEGKSLKSS